MGKKGSKLTPESGQAVDVLLQTLNALESISIKKMFGGHGVFQDGKMFCIVDASGKAFLKADTTNKPDFETMGATQHSRMPYFSIPDAVLADPSLLLSWAKKSIDIAHKK
jgi:DNA transformation protein